MTAIAQQRIQSPVAILRFLPVILGVAMLLGFYALPWVNQPERGATSAPVIAADRDANEIGIPREGLGLIPLGALAAIALGAWNILSPRQGRTVTALTALAGLFSLVYFFHFFSAAQQSEINLINAAGAGLWLVLICGLALVIQAALSRSLIPRVPGFEIGKTLGNQESVLALSMVLLVIVVGLLNSRFIADRNISDVLQGNAYIAVAAIGMSMVIISGNIDISVGSLIGVLATISGTMVVSGYPVWASWLVPLIIGGIVGAFNGFLVAYMRIPSIIVTLGMLSILKGGLIFVTGGTRITGMPPEYSLAQMRPLDIPMPVIIMIVLTALAAFWLRYSPTGRSIYAVGGNREAARLSGINDRGVVVKVFILNGVFVGIASVLYATQLSVIQATVPPNLELLIITAAVVGGVSILGGMGTVIGATLAAVLLNTIRSAMVFINVSPFWLQAVQGILILATVLVDIVRRRRQLL